MTTHTPGPWNMIEGMPMHDGRSFHVTGPEHHIRVANDLMRHDAALIAAAPELLEALKEVVPALKLQNENQPLNGKYDYVRDLLNGVNQAIAKAEGRTEQVGA